MKSNHIKRLIIVIILVITVGFAFMSIINFNRYNQIIRDNFNKTSEVITENIYSEIAAELASPIFTALSMKNNSFVIDWLKNEDQNDLEDLYAYLSMVKNVNNFSTAFLVSDRSRTYYHFNDVHKKVHESDPEDEWYYIFKNNDMDYDLDVGHDEAGAYDLTVFVNCRILDEEGNFLGIIGVGVVIKDLQAILEESERKYDVVASLVDDLGMTQVHTENVNIERLNIFEAYAIKDHKRDVLARRDGIKSYYVTDGEEQYDLFATYMEELNWHLFVKKDTGVLLKAQKTQLTQDTLIVLIVVLVVVLIVSSITNTYTSRILEMSYRDQLTGIYNRRFFDEHIEDTLDRRDEHFSDAYIAIFDIDHFKHVNDTYGHDVGDCVIKKVADIANEIIVDSNRLSRIGGDEFAAVLFMTRSDVEKKMKKLLARVYENDYLRQYNVSISIGITLIKLDDDAIAVFKKADEALYESKAQGRNRLTLNV